MEAVLPKVMRSKKEDKICRFGRRSKSTLMSSDIQNKVIDIISKEIALEIVNLMKGSIAWALTADTKSDDSKHEKLSLCVGTVSKSGNVSEHLLLYTCIVNDHRAIFISYCR